MQVIDEQTLDLEAYERGQLHQKVLAPDQCPCCQKSGLLVKWGYYWRWVISACERTDLCRIKVRRFRCMHCQCTVSVLPGFAQPRHQMSHELMADFMHGKRTLQVQRYEDLWKAMLRRFARFKDKLLRIVGYGLGRAPPHEGSALEVLFWLWQSCGKSFNKATACLIKGFHCSVFGQYRCHEATQKGGNPPI